MPKLLRAYGWFLLTFNMDQNFYKGSKPLVKVLSNFENMESHGKSIKPILRQLITWTPPKEGITLLKFFGGIGTSLEALLQLGMVVWKHLYVDIDLTAKVTQDPIFSQTWYD